MFKKRIKIEVIPACEYTDYSERFPDDEKYATLKHVALASSLPTLAAVGTGIFMYNNFKESYSSTLLPVNAQIPQPIIDPVVTQMPSIVPVNAVTQQTGILADKSLEMLATILDPLVQVMVTISFPIASVIMITGCFFFMLGNSEKAWSTIMNAGLGYVLIQMSPLFLDILRTIGEAV